MLHFIKKHSLEQMEVGCHTSAAKGVLVVLTPFLPTTFLFLFFSAIFTNAFSSLS